MKIWKYEIAVGEREVTLLMPHKSEIIHIGTDPNDEFCLWAKVDPTATKIQRAFLIYGTGEEFPGFLHYHGTAHVGSFIWHVMERVA